MSPPGPSIQETKAWEPEKPGVPTLLGRYRILGTIGKGGMGIVFKGFHLDLERDVAIKTMRIDKIGASHDLSRFRQEIKLIGRMDHEHVVRATDAGEKNGIFFLVMEFLTGLDLNTLVARNGSLKLADACELIRQAALGLAYIHQTLIHRDIKPSNLILTTSGQVKILDLGLAHCDQGGADDRDQTPTGMVLGTRLYMAPEQARGSRTIDARADIYSLGCTLFKLTTGTAPYGGPEYGNSGVQLYAHCHVPLTSVPAFELIPDELRPVLLRMMAKNPDERHQSGREVAEALAPFVRGSAPALLGAVGKDEPKVQPLPQPLPEELSRLTQSAVETPRDAPTVSAAAPAPQGKWTGGKLARRLAACVLVGILGALGWRYVPALFITAHRQIEQPEPLRRLDSLADVRNLDEIAQRQWHPLLDQRPFALGYAIDDLRVCRWSKGEQAIEVIGSSKVLFFLGKTTQSRFTFEVAIKQSPWTGNVGIFWGYRENEKIRKDGIPGRDFAWFQMLKLERQDGENHILVTRVHVTLRFNAQGEIAIEQLIGPDHPVPLKGGREVVLQIDVDGDRLKSALLGGFDLTKLFVPDHPSNFQELPCQGALGLISITHAGTFTNARFIIH